MALVSAMSFSYTAQPEIIDQSVEWVVADVGTRCLV
jgi:hypothetical protein